MIPVITNSIKSFYNMLLLAFNKAELVEPSSQTMAFANMDMRELLVNFSINVSPSEFIEMFEQGYGSLTKTN